MSAGPVLIFAGVSYLLPLLLSLTTVSFPRITYPIAIIFLGCNVFVVTQAQERFAALGVLRGLMGSGSMMNLLRSIQLLYLSPITSQSPKQRRHQDTRGRSIYQNRDVHTNWTGSNRLEIRESETGTAHSLGRVLDTVFINRREAGSPAQVKGVPPFRQSDPDYIPTRRTLLIQRFIDVVSCR